MKVVSNLRIWYVENPSTGVISQLGCLTPKVL